MTPEDSSQEGRWLRGWLRAVHHGAVLLCDGCMCNFCLYFLAVYYSIHVATSSEARSAETLALSSAPSRVFLPPCVHVPICLFKTVSICLLQLRVPRVAHTVCVHTCLGRRPGLRNSLWKGQQTCALQSVRHLGPPACVLSQKPRWTVQYYLDGTLVALEISKLLLF